MQREDVLGEALKLLELQGIANTTLEMVAERVDYPLDELRRFWPDKEAIPWDLRAPAPTPSHLRATVAIKGSFRGAEF